MPYVERNSDGAVINVFARPQPGVAEEYLADDDAELLARENPPSVLLAQKLAAGLAVTSTGTPALSATYALDQVTLDQIRALASDAAVGFGFPGGVSTFDYPDATGTPRTFTPIAIANLYKALRNYVALLNTTAAILAQGGEAEWPEAAATIP